MFFKSHDEAYVRRLEGRVEALERQVMALNQQLRSLSTDLGVDIPNETTLSTAQGLAPSQGTEVSDVIHTLLSKGKTVAAIKAYRKETGSDLLSAKNTIDAVARRYGYA